MKREETELAPRSHHERIALFRSEVVGALTRQELEKGRLQEELERLSKQRFRPPGASSTRTYSFATLERWYYKYRKGGLKGVRRALRRDKGRARKLSPELRQLLLDIRSEHPAASVPLILRTLEFDGRIRKGLLSPQTLRRLYVQNGLDRIAAQDGEGPKTRLRWQTEKANGIWHGDVCHAPAVYINSKAHPIRIHALLDDASRYVVALEAHHTEREMDMLGVMVRAINRHGPCDALFLDYVPRHIIEVLFPTALCVGVGSDPLGASCRRVFSGT